MAVDNAGVQSIGQLYDANNVVVGQAAGYIAAANTALPVDHDRVFDPLIWSPWKITAMGGATTVTPTVVNKGVTYAGTAITVAAATPATIVAGFHATVQPFVLAAVITAGTAWNMAFTSNFRYATLTLVGAGGSPTLVAPAWTPWGATDTGWQVNYAPTTQQITIEEQPTPVGVQISSAQLQFVANASEDTVTQLAFAYGATQTVTAVGANQPGKTRLAIPVTSTPYAMALETANAYNLPRVYYAPTGVIVPGGSTFKRAANQRIIPVTFNSTCNLSQFVIDEVTAAQT